MTDKVLADDVEKLVVQFQNSDARELHIKFEGFELYLSKDDDAAGINDDGGSFAATSTNITQSAYPGKKATPQMVTATPQLLQREVSFPDHATIVRATYLGTFYRAPKPGAPTYVEVGAAVKPESDLCLIEVMKLFTAIRAGVSGKITQILARDGEMVCEGQPLFVIEAE